MNAWLAANRIDSGWPELLPPGVPAVEALLIQGRIHADNIADAEKTAHLKGYEEAQADYQPEADRVPELEAEAERLQSRIDDLQDQLSDLLEEDAGAIMRTKLIALHGEWLDTFHKIERVMETATRKTDRRRLMFELKTATYAFFTAATTKETA